MLKLHVLYSEFINNVEDAKIDIKVIRWPRAKNDINCSEMLNTVQERKRCNRLVIIPWRNTIPFQKLIGDHFGVHVKRNGDHLVVGIILGSIWGSFRGWDHFGDCTGLFSKVRSRAWCYLYVVITHIDLARAKSESLVNVYCLLKQNTKSCNAKRRRQQKLAKKISRSKLKNWTTLHVQHTFSCISLPLFCTTTTGFFQKLPSYTFYGENIVCVPVHFFFAATHLHLGGL